MKKIIPLIVVTIFICTSFSILFVSTNFSSLNKELQDYLRISPYASVIEIGHSGHTAQAIPKVERYTNQVDNLLLAFAGEDYTSLSGRPEFIEEYNLKEEEAEQILKLPGIKSYFYYDESESIFMWSLKTASKISGVFGVPVFPLPINYLKALHPPLKEGRYFDGNDPYNVILIREDLATMLFGDGPYLGRNVAVSTGEGETNFEIIGVLAKVPDSYSYASFITAFVIIPYKPTERTYFFRGQEKVYAVSYKELKIIPEEGKENQVLRGVRHILDKEKYESIVASATWILKSSFGTQIRKERITTLSVASIIILLVSIFTIVSFIYFDITSKRRDMGIRRSLGASIFQISKEYCLYLIKLFLLGFSIALLALYLLFPFFTKYNTLGYWLQYQAPSETYPLRLDFASVVFSFLLLFIIVYLVSTISVYKYLRESPAHLMKPSQEKREKSYIPSLIIVTVLSVIMIFTSLSIILTGRKLINELFLDISPQTLRIYTRYYSTPEEARDIFSIELSANYTSDDYEALREVFDGKALVGFRLSVPYSSQIGDPQNPERSFNLRVSEASEDFTEIYELKLSKGKFLSDKDSGNCVIGYDVAKFFNLNLGDDFMGWKITGILEKKSPLIDRTMYISLRESLARYSGPFATTPPGILLLKPIEGNAEDIGNEALDILERRHPGKARGTVADVALLVNQVMNAREGTYVFFQFSHSLPLSRHFCIFLPFYS